MSRFGRIGLISVFVLLVSATPALASSQGASYQITNGTRSHAGVRPPGASFTPFGPVRIVDSRKALGLASGLKDSVAATFQVAGVLGIPSNAVAVSGNLTVADENHNGFVSLTTDPTNAPTTSTLNIIRGDVRANGVMIALSSTGSLSATAVHMNCSLVFDVTGYFTNDDTQDSWYPLVPARLLDTRSRIGLSGKFLHATPRVLQVTGFGGVPTGATAITANVTTVNSTASSWVAVTVSPTASPTTSTLNFPAGDIRANNLIAPLAADGSIALDYNGTGSTDLILDVTGYFMKDNDGGLYVPVSPSRVMDSRTPLGLPGPFVAGKPGTLALSGVDGIDSNTVAITGNLTAANVTGGGYGYILPSVAYPPTTSILNVPAGDTRANGFVGVLAGDQSIAVGYQSGTGHADLIIDLTGYFVAPPMPAASAAFTGPAPGTTTDVFATGEDVTWTETGTIRSVALSQFWSLPTGDGCSSTWNVATTITATTTDQVYSNYSVGHCYMYAITLNGDPSTTVHSGVSRYPAPAAKIPVLMYHRVSPTIDPGSQLPGLVVDPTTFDAQMKALHDAGWRTITAADMGHRMATHAFISDKTFVITFDDGRDDGYVYAYPILKKYGFVATYYMITSRVNAPYLSWDQAAEMASNGMEIATHTIDHSDVLTLNAAGLAHEIGDSKTAIETSLASRGVTATVTTFSYPFGHYTTAAENYLSSHGFTAAFTENSGAVRAGMNMEALPRVRVSRGESPATLLAAIAAS